MTENSFEWFKQQAEQTREHVATWPDWMKNTSDVATAAFPVVGSTDAGACSDQEGAQRQLAQRGA